MTASSHLGNNANSSQGGSNLAHRRTDVTFTELDGHGCRTVLAAERVGRIAWTSADGPIILPVTYIFQDTLIGFRTSPYGPLAQLIGPTPVAFEVDTLDRVRSTGDSVLVRGVAQAADRASWNLPDWTGDVVPWAGGLRNLAIEITIKQITGRSIRRSHGH